MIAESGGAPGKPEQHGMAPSPAGGLESFAQIVAYLGEHREVNLQVELERYVRPGPVRYGYFSCELEGNAPNDLLARLKAFLERDTGDDWVVEQIRTNAETMRQTEIRTREELFASAAAHPAVADALKSIPGITIVDVTEPPTSDGNVIDLNSRRSA
jgi:DNA polymerase-3 subunit gamma/tau